MTKQEHNQIKKLTGQVDTLTNQVSSLTTTVQAMSIQLNQNTKDTSAIKLTLAGWTGGRKALVWVIGVLGIAGMIAASVYGALRAAVK